MFSGGAASAVVGKIVTETFGKQDTILLHTPTFSEHPDADRFREDIAAYIGVPITVAADGRDIWTLIKDQHCLPSYWIPFCTRILKIDQTDKFIGAMTEDFILYYGYGPDEWARVQKQSSRFDGRAIKSEYPLSKLMIKGETAKSIVKDKWGICLPATYQHLEHNNCLPCFKGGKKYFKTISKYYPEYFKRAMDAESETGHTIFKNCSLKDIQEATEAEISLFPADEDTRPCMCAM
jgi:hypothetical protein